MATGQVWWRLRDWIRNRGRHDGGLLDRAVVRGAEAVEQLLQPDLGLGSVIKYVVECCHIPPGVDDAHTS